LHLGFPFRSYLYFIFISAISETNTLVYFRFSIIIIALAFDNNGIASRSYRYFTHTLEEPMQTVHHQAPFGAFGYPDVVDDDTDHKYYKSIQNRPIIKERQKHKLL